MIRKPAAGLFCVLLVLGLLTLTLQVRVVNAKTWYVDGSGGKDFTKIQQAINSASSGDTIYVYSGTYSEHVIVNKSLTLIGQSNVDTIIDGAGQGTVVTLKANGATVDNFFVTGSGSVSPKSGVLLDNVVNARIVNNNVSYNNGEGIFINGTSSFATISGNAVRYNQGSGIVLGHASNVLVEGNSISNNVGNGTMASVGSENFAIRRNSIVGNGEAGISLEDSSYASITGNNITDNYQDGIHLWSSNSLVVGNNLTRNGDLFWAGLYLTNAIDDLIYHNNFVDNNRQVDVFLGCSGISWDDGYPSGGNYWNNKEGSDIYNGPSQNLPGSDGIWDTAYVIDESNQDRYPFVHVRSSLVSLVVQVSGHGFTNVTGTHTYIELTNVTVLATPDSGYYLAYWLRNGTNDGLANPHTITMTANYNLTAVFARIKCNLFVGVVGHGVTNNTGTHTYDKFTKVTVLATPASGSFFDHWLLNGTNVGSVNPYTLNMTSNFNLIAVFLAVPRTLTVSVVGSGSTNATGAFTYDEFSIVSVLATPHSGHYLFEWLLDGGHSGNANPYTVNMTADYHLTAVFAPIPYNLTVGVSGQGSTNATGTFSHDAFTNVSVLATADVGHFFDRWVLNGSNVGSVNPYTINMTGNFDLIAVFTPIEYGYLVVRGGNDMVYYRVYDVTGGGSWQDWRVVPDGTTLDSPAAAACGDKLYFVVRGMDGYRLWFSWVNLTDYSFSGWSLVPGASESAPVLVRYGSSLVLVVRAMDDTMYYRLFDCASATWGDWAPWPGGSTVDTPAASMLGDELHLVVRGGDGSSLWHSSLNLTSLEFSGWEFIAGASDARPVLAVSQSMGTLYLVVRGMDGSVYYNVYDGSAWKGWSVFPNGSILDGPSAAVVSDRLCVVVRGSDGITLWHDSFDLGTNGFSGWTYVTGSTGSTPRLTV